LQTPTIVAGIHYHHSEKGNDHSIEPRLGFDWAFNQDQSISLGMGIHSQLQPLFVYNYQMLTDNLNQTYTEPNKDLKLSRSNHVVVGYNYLFTENLRLKIEGYYQYLYNVPVEKEPSYKSMTNYGSTFSLYDFNELENKGTGRNYGAEITFEKFLSNNYYYLATLSLFDSKYRGSDRVLRNTRYNCNIIANILGGYEWQLKNHNTFATDVKAVYAGGERKIPINLKASKIARNTVYDITSPYEEQFPHFLSLDVRISYKINRPRLSHVIAIDLKNVTNRYNHLIEIYNPMTEKIEEASLVGLMPMFLWRMNF
jgi:hypothetical protein